LSQADDSERERIPVKSHAYGMRLLDFLEHRWPNVHRAYFRRLVLAEMVRVNRIIGTPYTTLRQGDVIDITRPPGEPPPRPRARAEVGAAARLVHAGEQVVLVDKPAGQGVEDAIAALGSSVPAGCKPVLRADVDACGLVVLAPTAAAHRTLTDAFASGRLSLEWWALVEGRITRADLRIDKALGPDRSRPGCVRAYARDAKRARPARTDVVVVETFGKHTLVRATPRTDRGHQLRVHLAAVHHAIVGDAQYGASAALLVSDCKRRYKPRVGVAERPIVQRLCLHAQRFSWQTEAGELAFESPLPKDLATALARLRRYSEP
jgi:23S rRNA-/tRNA-specific pseudouridylate synthase